MIITDKMSKTKLLIDKKKLFNFLRKENLLFAFVSKVFSIIFLFLLFKDKLQSEIEIGFSSGLTLGTLGFVSALNSFIIIYITSMVILIISKPFEKNTDRDTVKSTKMKSTKMKSTGMKSTGIFLRHMRAKKVGFFSTGCLPLGVILVRGNVSSVLDNMELSAVIQHEKYHIYYCNILIRFFVLFLLKDILPPVGPLGYLLWCAIFFQMGYFFEFLADRYAAQKVSANAVIQAVEKLTGKNERLYEILEYIPFFNIILLTHPCLSFRKYMLGL